MFEKQGPVQRIRDNLANEAISEAMREALRLARLGKGKTSPNPAVGAVVVAGERVVGRGYHAWANVKHAETVALDEAGDAARGATVYVTLEPCSHQGRTPPCADRLIAAGVARVVAAMEDPNPQVSGEGFRKLRAAGIAVEMEAAATPEAERLNEAYLHFVRTGLPLVTVKAALTLDGKIAAPQDNLGWITSEVARANVQLVRHESDVILTGIGTVIEDDCLLTDRSGLERSRALLRVVLDSQLRMPLDSKMVGSAQGDVLVVCTSAAPAQRKRALEERGVEVWLADGAQGRTDVRAVLEMLARRRYESVMVEAGALLNWAVLDSQVADKVLFYYAPKILGGLKSLPVAGGVGRQRRADAILFDRLQLHPISTNEFAVEAYLVKGG